MPRQCRRCARIYEPSSGHLDCPACRSRDAQKTCDCGRRMHKESSTCSVCRPRPALDRNGYWKGGKTRNKAGYVMARAPDHPRAPANGGYVFEHILVMEQIIRRRLLPDETVHHRNGVKADNRPENLELWTANHPTGVRAVDAVSWATEILARYGGWDIVAEPLGGELGPEES